MKWVVISKVISALSILIQIVIFARFLPEIETKAAYASIASIALVSQFAVALPILITSQSSWLPDSIEKNEFKKSLIIVFIFSLTGGAIAASVQNPFDSYLGYLLLCLTPLFACFPNLYSANRFGAGDLKNGAIFNIFNVVFPQCFAALFALIYKEALAWLGGLLIGHFIAGLVIRQIWSQRDRSVEKLKGSRPPLRLGPSIACSTAIALIFSWVIPNFPRVYLLHSEENILVTKFLLIGAMCFSISNALETLIIQIRRSKWLAFKENADAIPVTGNINGESICILFFYIFAIIPISLLSFALIWLIDVEITYLGFKVFLMVATVESMRAFFMSFYAIAEAERTQSRFASIIFFSATIFCSCFVVLPSASIEGSYFYGAFALLALAVCATAFRFARNLASESV